MMTRMSAQKNASQFFTKLIIASTAFLAPLSYSAGPTTISTVLTVPPTVDTTTNGNITITATGAINGTTDGIQVDSPNSVIVINSDNASTISPDAIKVSGGANAGIFVLGAGANASITVGKNSSITSDDGRAIYIFSNAGSTLTNSGTLTGGESAVVLLASNTVVLNNDTGSIISTIFPALRLFGDAGSDITNSGTIQSDTAPAILLDSGGSVLSIDNTDTGLITATNADVISVIDNTALGSFTNSGTITANGLNNAINLSGTTSNITITNNDLGTITGDVIVSSNALAGIVLQMNGGTIDGVVQGLASGAARTFDIAGGTITGGIDLSAGTSADIINLSGGSTGDILGNTGVGQIINILNSVTTSGSITDIDNIIVNTGAILGGNDPISNVLNLTINTGAGLINTNTLTGTNITINAGGVYQQNTLGSTTLSGLLKNSGTLRLPVLSYPTSNVVTATFNQSATGTLDVPIKDAFNYGQLQVLGAATVAGNMQLSLTGIGFNQSGDLYRVVRTGAPVIGGMNILQPTSQTLNFAQVVDPNNITLQVTRVSLFYPLADSPQTQGPAAVLDSFLPNPSNPEIRGVIGALDALANVNDGLRMLVPPFDGGLIEWSQGTQAEIFEGLGRYIDEHKWITALIPGYVAGDVGMGRKSELVYSRGTWAKVWGARARQAPRDISEGYDLETIGVMMGYDQYCSDRVVLGGALSYATGSVSSKDLSHNEQSAKSFQLTAYSTYDYKGPGYLDTMIGVAFNNYITQRNVLIGAFNESAFSDYDGWNYGINLESGYRFSYAKYRIIPVLKARYSRLQIDDYTESDAGGIGLSVSNEPIEQGITAIGIKFNSTNDYSEATYVPEFRFNIIYDWINDASLTTSNFILGGPVFTTEGFKPQSCTYNFGFSLSLLAQESLVGVLNFDLDLRKDFVTYLASLKMRYEW